MPNFPQMEPLRNAVFSQGDPTFVKRSDIDVMTKPREPPINDNGEPDPLAEYPAVDLFWRISAGQGRTIKTATKTKRKRNIGGKRGVTK